MNERRIDASLAPLRELLGRRETLALERHFAFTTKQNFKTEVFFMANIDFESLKQKITDTAGTVVDKTVDLAKTVAEKAQDAAKTVAGKTQDAARRAKLNAQIASEREGMKKKYTELGKLYYEKYSSNPDPDLAEPMTAITEALDRVAARQAELDALDTEPEPEAEPETETEAEAEAEPEVEPDHIVDEVEQTREHEADRLADMAEEAAEEAQKTYEDAVKTVDLPE